MSASDRSPLTSTVPSECWGDAASHYAGRACHESEWAAKLAAAEAKVAALVSKALAAVRGQEAAEARARDLERQRTEADCRFAGRYAEMSGSHCPIGDPCQRCQLAAAEARVAELEAALKEIAVRPCLTGGEVTGDYRTCPELEAPTREHWCAGCIARRALAKGEDRG